MVVENPIKMDEREGVPRVPPFQESVIYVSGSSEQDRSIP